MISGNSRIGGAMPMPLDGRGSPLGRPIPPIGPAANSRLDAAAAGMFTNQSPSSYFPPMPSNYAPPAASVYNSSGSPLPPLNNLPPNYNSPGINNSNYMPAAGPTQNSAINATMSKYTPVGNASQYVPPSIGVTSPSQYTPMNGMSFSKRNQ